MTPPGFSVWDGSLPDHVRQWEDAWRIWPRREVFAHPGYVSLYATAGVRPFCTAWQSAEGCVLYPLLIRDLPGGCDLTTPYGYGGPYAWGTSDPAALAKRFWEAYAAWTVKIRAVSEFVRFDLQEGLLLPYPGERVWNAENVVCDLTLTEQDSWKAFDHKVRKNVKKAQRSGVTVEIDPTGARLEDFLRIYYSTMERRGAGTSYYFPREYFSALATRLAGQTAYFHAVLEGRVVSTELVLISAENIYSFLGGTEEAAFEARPNDLLKHEIMLWGGRQGKRRFVLGGGYEPGDGIFRYKRAFAPTGCVPFFTGRSVLLPEAYARLVDEKRAAAQRDGVSWEPKPGFFPAYRA